MKLHYRNIEPTSSHEPFLGLVLEVSGVSTAWVSVSVCRRRIRLATGMIPRIWTKLDDDYYGYELLRSAERQLNVIPPIPFDFVSTISGPDSLEKWAKAFAKMLRDGPESMLHNGIWRLAPIASLQPAEISKIVEQDAYAHVDWDIGDYLYPITLRDMSAADSGRVKAWRKHARLGTLPPILLYWVSGLDACVVLDGHDRLLAARLEETPILALELGRYREEYQDDPVKEIALNLVGNALDSEDPSSRIARLKDAKNANPLLLKAFSPHGMTVPTQARVMSLQNWSTEVQKMLARRGISDTTLLADGR